jgi:hypothetical protein
MRRVFLTWLLLLAGLPAFGFADEKVLLEKPVRVLTSDEANIFPESWRKPPVSASGGTLNEEHFERVKKTMAKALAKYPAKVLEKHLENVYILSELKYSGISAGGTNSRTCVYVKVSDVKKGYSDHHIEDVFHAEFSSIFLRNLKKDFPTDAWAKINPPGFKYFSSGVEAIKKKKVGLANEELLQQGFLSQYGQSDMENDFNGFAGKLFTGDAKLWQNADKHPKIQAKLKLTLEFYSKLDESFSEKFFKELVGK